MDQGLAGTFILSLTKGKNERSLFAKTNMNDLFAVDIVNTIKKDRRKNLTDLQRWQVEIVEEISSIAQAGLKPKQARILRKGYGIMLFIFLQG